MIEHVERALLATLSAQFTEWLPDFDTTHIILSLVDDERSHLMQAERKLNAGGTSSILPFFCLIRGDFLNDEMSRAEQRKWPKKVEVKETAEGIYVSSGAYVTTEYTLRLYTDSPLDINALVSNWLTAEIDRTESISYQFPEIDEPLKATPIFDPPSAASRAHDSETSEGVLISIDFPFTLKYVLLSPPRLQKVIKTATHSYYQNMPAEAIYLEDGKPVT